MKKIEWPLIIGPRIITIKNPNQSLYDFLRPVQAAFFGARVFVSKKIFSEVWDACLTGGGEITSPDPKKDYLMYAFTSGKKNQKDYLRIVFLVYPEAEKNQQIELIKAQGRGMDFVGNMIGEKFFIDRAPEKKNEFEK